MGQSTSVECQRQQSLMLFLAGRHISAVNRPSLNSLWLSIRQPLSRFLHRRAELHPVLVLHLKWKITATNLQRLYASSC